MPLSEASANNEILSILSNNLKNNKNSICLFELGKLGGQKENLLRAIPATEELEPSRGPLQIVSDTNIKQRLTPSSGVIVGWSRNTSGKIVPLYSNSASFESVRDLPSTSPFGSGWNEKRSAEIVPLEVTKDDVRDLKLLESSFFQSLPPDFQAVFKSGAILKTTSKSTSYSKWSLLMITAPDGADTGGRTGIVLKNGIPVVLVDPKSGKEFLIELKGAGAPDGTFSKHENYTFRGGAVARQVEREHANMVYVETFGEDTVKSGGFVTFVSSLGQQGILFRLTPGTVRGTFTNSSAFKPSQNTKTRMVHDYGKIWGNFLGQGAIPMSHPENIVADAKMENFFPTDLSDVLPVTRFPVNWGHRKVDLREALSRSLVSYKEIGGIEASVAFVQFKEGLVDGLTLSGLNPSAQLRQRILNATDIKEVEEIILTQILHSRLLQELKHTGFKSSLASDIESHKNQIPEPKLLIAKMRAEAKKYSEELSRKPSDVEKSRFYDALSRSDNAVLEFLGEVGHQRMNRLDDEIKISKAPKGRISTGDLMHLIGVDLLSLKVTLENSLEELVALLSSSGANSSEIQVSLQIAKQRLAQVQSLTLLQISQIANQNYDYFISLLDIPYFKK